MAARDATTTTIDRELSLLISRAEKNEEIELGYLGPILEHLLKARQLLEISYLFPYESYAHLQTLGQVNEDE